MIGTPVISTRGSEYLGEGNAQKYSAHQEGNRPMASQYRLGQRSILDFPNKFVGPEKCGECHAIQYEQWKRSRHAKTVRFPGEHPEVDNDLKKKLYGSEASILPDGITADVITPPSVHRVPNTATSTDGSFAVPTTFVTVCSKTAPVRLLPAATSSPAAGQNG